MPRSMARTAQVVPSAMQGKEHLLKGICRAEGARALICGQHDDSYDISSWLAQHGLKPEILDAPPANILDVQHDAGDSTSAGNYHVVLCRSTYRSGLLRELAGITSAGGLLFLSASADEHLSDEVNTALVAEGLLLLSWLQDGGIVEIIVHRPALAPCISLPPKHACRPLVYFFGLPASGKSHCGELLEKHFGYVFHDGDKWLPEDMHLSLRQGKGFTPEQRDRYAAVIAQNISAVADVEVRAHGEQARPLAIAQATFKLRHREMIQRVHPDVTFVWVRTDEDSRMARLRQGCNLVDEDLGRKMALNFEAPEPSEGVIIVENSSCIGHDGLLFQLRALASR